MLQCCQVALREHAGNRIHKLYCTKNDICIYILTCSMENSWYAVLKNCTIWWIGTLALTCVDSAELEIFDPDIICPLETIVTTVVCKMQIQYLQINCHNTPILSKGDDLAS